ncbi:SusC/RagA family TonB-linked outer membrane protein [Spirosoma utsteinense]|uniref:TonB-linked SusC/RagA family outer membrane protein n=1 Tax=Spirosoma utsteinense TaxID=2585773 RepID=A0ABR6W670_9BACT|nr:TonB-dependent receptor [Spirosoma utsteinense]MBC3785571.1 TonB-linked SusC/RagA family outer membrane protein [Spirosoma utsteinense]MBC3791719.1 TonB-linked SusC/RagA family outer membrane protein [Spirosoma utsteinense]
MKKIVPFAETQLLVRRAFAPIALSLLLGPVLAKPASFPSFPPATGSSLASRVAADLTISGTVTDEKGESLPGVNVVIKGSTKGSTTDAQGLFTITVPDPATVLVFSFVGYRTQELAVGSATRLTIKLVADDQSLDEVVVVGYGTQSRGTVTGAVAAVKAEDIIRTPAVATSSALVGRVPGITARQTDARPGGGTNIQIRNMGTPLYVIDGIVADAGQFNNLGINDIENISILKDGSAAIYGLRAANGVVLVTTKRGKAGQKPVISLSGYYGLQNFTRYPRPANAYQHVRGLAESDQNRGIPTTITADDLEKWRVGTEKGYQSYDYYKMVMRPNVPQSYLNGSVSGGSESVTYYVSASHLSQDALIEDFKFQRSNFQANVEAGLSKKLRIGAQISGRIEDRFQTGVPGLDDYFNPFLSIFSMWPTERPYANDNPKYINQTHNVNVNPATYKKEITGTISEIYRAAKANFTAQYDFDFGLSVKGTYSYNFTNFDFDGFEYTYDAYNYDAATDTYNVVQGGGNQNPWRERRKRNIVDRFGQLQATYNKQFGEHGLSAVAAYERYDTDNKYLVVHTVPPNNYIPLMSFANQDLLIDEWNVTARAGYIGRVNYNYKQRYLLEVLGRYDGSFLFAPGRRYGFFPGASVGWRMSEEPFFKQGLGNVISELKLRASYGRTGSDLINDNFIVAPYSYLSGYDFLQGSAIFNGNYTIGVRPRGLPITTLSWVSNVSTNVGLDFGLFNGNLSGQFDVFERKRTGLPASQYDVLLPSEVGYTLPNANLNSDAIRGIEGALSYSSKVGGLTYTVGANATLARLRSLSIYKPRFGNSFDEYRNSAVDRWSNINWGYQVAGRFQSQQEIDNYAVDNDGQGNRTQLPGDLIYRDVNGDGIITSLDERPIGYAEGATPYVNYAFNGTLGYRGFSLRVDVVGAGLQTFRREVEQKIPYQNNGTSPDYILEDRWHRADPFNADSPWVPGTYPVIRKDNPSHVNYNRRSDFWVTNVRYLRLRNLEIGYNLPKPFLSKFGASAMRVYVNGTNLISFDNLKSIQVDPEVSSNGALVYPPQRLYNAGFALSF